MSARRFILILAVVLAVTQSAAYTDCCCATECARTAAPALPEDSSCCGSEAPPNCTHVETPQEIVLEPGDALSDCGAFVVPTFATSAAVSLPREGGHSVPAFQDTGPPLYLRLHVLRL